jgi:large subunit ribosomal protein L32e
MIDSKTKIVRKKKPTFARQDSHKKKRINPRWRRSKGLQSKMRLSKKGYRKSPRIGYGSTKNIKNLHPSGLKEVLVSSVEAIKNIQKDEGALIAKVGLKLKVELIKQAITSKVILLNVPNPSDFLKSVEEKINKKKESRKKSIKKKADEKEKAKKKADEKEKQESVEEKLENKNSDDDKVMIKDKKLKEKQEKDKLLTRKD